MSILVKRLQYYRRILPAYLGWGRSQLTFWHDTPEPNPAATVHQLGEYYMQFSQKADYAGPHDADGIPLLDYRGQIGRQYNPIAVAQWGLGNYNLFCRSRSEERKTRFLGAADWLCRTLEPNAHGVWVWNHQFDWEYRSRLKAPWYSGLAQGQGISLLLRAYRETHAPQYREAATRALHSFLRPVEQGGVSFRDAQGNLWFEEYIVAPPTHILNGFLWAMWGVYDYFLATGEPEAQRLFDAAVQTVLANLQRYDLGFWSLYELSGTRLPMVASPFYHRLHIVQLGIMQRLTGEKAFADFADRWDSYTHSRAKRTRAVCYKGAFKLCYY
ncbi:MAG: hypothetical protein JST79_08015 [Acidobacteria bacterium]|nr:hypothetical protein [Acidobacteriota bacterium]